MFWVSGPVTSRSPSVCINVSVAMSQSAMSGSSSMATAVRGTASATRWGADHVRLQAPEPAAPTLRQHGSWTAGRARELLFPVSVLSRFRARQVTAPVTTEAAPPPPPDLSRVRPLFDADYYAAEYPEAPQTPETALQDYVDSAGFKG